MVKSAPTQLASGFTLIELLVVIAIISLLSSSVLTALSSVRNQARLAANKRFEQSIRSSISDCSIAFYNFEGSSNTTIREAGGAAPDGDLFGNPPRVDSLEGLGQAIDLDGTDDYIAVNNFSHDTTAGWTVSAWIQPDFSDTEASNGSLLRQKVDSNNNWALGYIGQTGGPGTFLFKSSNERKKWNQGFENDEWAHIAATWDKNGNKTVYWDGGEVFSSNGPTTDSAGTSPLYIGKWVNSSRYWDGKIDNVRIYDCGFEGGN
jgi:prepilin-type N-terminal cleavage/methylation domain-containing protein